MNLSKPTIQMPHRSGPALIQMKSKANNLAKQEIKKALEEDPSVFAYDDVYDDMKSAAAGVSGNETKGPKKPKYMDNLLKSAELRKREKDRREEKMIQKEREKEGDEFKDKEAFVTSAYKEKLIELRQTEARERNEAAFEDRLDVRKQQDLSGFYRHLLNQETGSEKITSLSSSNRFDAPVDQKTDAKTCFKKSTSKANRNLRERLSSGSEDEEADASSHQREEPAANPQSAASTTNVSKSDDGKQEKASDSKTVTTTSDAPPESEAKPEPPPKVDRRTLVLKVFEKRTVGEVFEDAVRRFHERQKERGS